MENEKFKSNKGLEEIIVHLLDDNIKLQAEILALKSIFELLYAKIDPNFDLQKVRSIQQTVVQSYMQQVIASHPLYSDYWKNQLKDLGSLGVDI